MKRGVWSAEELIDILMGVALVAKGLPRSERTGFALALTAIAQALGIDWRGGE